MENNFLESDKSLDDVLVEAAQKADSIWFTYRKNGNIPEEVLEVVEKHFEGDYLNDVRRIVRGRCSMATSLGFDFEETFNSAAKDLEILNKFLNT